MNIEEFLKPLVSYTALATEAVAVVIVAVGVVLTVARLAAARAPLSTIRLYLGRWLALALEFELAADVLRTAVAPTWNEIGQLAAIAALRTALNYFLERDINNGDARDVVPAAVSSQND